MTPAHRQGYLDGMDRTFACPKPPFSLTAFARRATTRRGGTAPQGGDTLTGRPGTTMVATEGRPAVDVGPTGGSQSWSARWDGGWAAGSWSKNSWTAVSWGNPAATAPFTIPGPPVTTHPLETIEAARRPAPSTTVPPARQAFPVTVFGINEPTPGPRWKALFDATWPAYRAWYLSEGDAARPNRETATAALERYMPELLPTYRKLVQLTGDDPMAARMLTLWNAPAFLPACSQAVVTEPEPLLCRNYDYSPELWEQTVYTSEFTGRKVIGTGDCLWGLLDGMNDAGLVVSLTFGGRPGSGPGFAIPLVVRYLLEVATTTPQARELLRGLPIAMSYNLTIVDASGDACTAFVAPGQEPEFSAAPVATNHHGRTPEFPERAERLRSVPRLERLSALTAERPAADELAAAFLSDPLYNDEYSKAFGTLYTALYRPKDRVVEYHWPDVVWRRGFADQDDSRQIVLSGR